MAGPGHVVQGGLVLEARGRAKSPLRRSFVARKGLAHKARHLRRRRGPGPVAAVEALVDLLADVDFVVVHLLPGTKGRRWHTLDGGEHLPADGGVERVRCRTGGLRGPLHEVGLGAAIGRAECDRRGRAEGGELLLPHRGPGAVRQRPRRLATVERKVVLLADKYLPVGTLLGGTKAEARLRLVFGRELAAHCRVVLVRSGPGGVLQLGLGKSLGDAERPPRLALLRRQELRACRWR
mmetsp:Transcript_414/g.1192  ORF Transcript_414/g.1192 Transcript_414/m.1192 type:complete len:237 (+) Transcript_414:436-1146(+)|eukprot:CAMPEP_0206037832 /NCGR_PEP_ID=MMETSP1466-20131121/3704_1 /ASSEMBLY_ACC=CAM_ASM_001126 /TAXON_ID=44452 /ORGANISM="Pavlova gyrans, Strain CCMP608" /LENGTH=236 /DNA_ID=CAMNT_0053412401 /DNA_START=307 /DNA_END=1017 /DNA_ORIENTATION=-